MLIAVATNRARTRRVPWINQDHGNSRTPRFVKDELLQLIEAPVSKLKTHLSVKTVTSLSDTCQVFKSECLTELNRSFDKSAADVVVHPFGEPRLTAAKPSKVTLSRLRTTLLKSSTKPSQGATNLASRFPTVLISFAVRGNLNNAQVNTNRTVDGAQGRVLHITNGHEVELTVYQNKVRLSPLPFKEFGLVLAADKGNVLPACDGPDAYLLLVQDVAQNSGVVGNGSVGSESAGSDQRRAWAPLCELVHLVGIGDLGKEQCNGLRGQVGVLTNLLIESVVKVKPLKNLLGESKLRNLVSGLVGRFQRFSKGFSLLRIWQKFDLCNEFHFSYSIKQKSNNPERARAFPSGVALLPRQAKLPSFG